MSVKEDYADGDSDMYVPVRGSLRAGHALNPTPFQEQRILICWSEAAEHNNIQIDWTKKNHKLKISFLNKNESKTKSNLIYNQTNDLLNNFY